MGTTGISLCSMSPSHLQHQEVSAQPHHHTVENRTTKYQSFPQEQHRAAVDVQASMPLGHTALSLITQKKKTSLSSMSWELVRVQLPRAVDQFCPSPPTLGSPLQLGSPPSSMSLFQCKRSNYPCRSSKYFRLQDGVRLINNLWTAAVVQRESEWRRRRPVLLKRIQWWMRYSQHSNMVVWMSVQ